MAMIDALIPDEPNARGRTASEDIMVVPKPSQLFWDKETDPVDEGMVTFVAATPQAPVAAKLGRTLAELFDQRDLQELDTALHDALTLSRRASEAPPHPALEGLEQEPLSDAERLEATLGGMVIRFSLRRRLLTDALTADEVAERLGLLTPAVDELRASRLVVAIEDRNANWAYPACQFDEDQPDGMVKDLRRILPLLDGLGPLETASWLIRPKPGLGGKRPIEELRRGNVEQVELLARRIAGLRG